MSPLVDPWPDAPDRISLCSSQNNMYYSSLITVDQPELTRSDKSENLTQVQLLSLQPVLKTLLTFTDSRKTASL